MPNAAGHSFAANAAVGLRFLFAVLVVLWTGFEGAQATSRNVWGSGRNWDSQLGIEGKGNRLPWATPRQISQLHGENISMIAAGYAHTLAVSERGLLLVW